MQPSILDLAPAERPGQATDTNRTDRTTRTDWTTRTARLDRVVDVLTGQLLGLTAATVGLLLMCWNLGRPALWLDESASEVATQRSWPHLWQLLQGTDAPLVPYYVLLKAQKWLIVALFPQAAADPEVLLRWPSAVAVALTGWVLVSWLRTAGTGPVAAGAGAVLLLIEGVSRYGQEARPYALVLLLATVTTAVWWRLMRTVSPLATVAYTGCVATMAGLHALSATLVLAHLLAAVLIRRDDLLLRILSTVCGAVAGLLVASPMTFAAMAAGSGASHYPPLTGGHLLTAFGSLFDGAAHPGPRLLAILVPAALGLTRWNDERTGDLARLAACWAVVPALVMIPAMAVQPNLLLARYVLFVVPGWAILAGLGLSALAGFVAAAVRADSATTIGLSWAVLVLGVPLLALAQRSTLVAVRAPAGHGEDVRPALAQLQRLPYRSLPLVVASQTGAIELGAYAPADAARMLTLRPQTDQADIWPAPVDPATARAELATTSTIVLLTHDGRCGPMPGYLSHFEVLRTTFTPGRWTFYLLQRLSPPRGARIPPARLPPPSLPCPALHTLELPALSTSR